MILDCACSGMARFASTTAIPVASAGILPLMVQNVKRPMPLTVSSICILVHRQISKICTASVRLKECAKQSAKAQCAWDSGSVTVMATVMLTRTQDGIQYPGFTWRRFRPRSTRSLIFMTSINSSQSFFARISYIDALHVFQH